jgi:sec-independent protein translocase protein TatB
VFGFSFGEVMILLLVGVIVVGPRKLPTLMRTAGQWVAKLRRLSTDLRTQSGIDEIIRQEGLETEIRELRALSRVNVIDTLVTPALTPSAAPAVARPRPPPAAPPVPRSDEPLREREYPLLGCDSYDALPDDVLPYLQEEVALASRAAGADAPADAGASPDAPRPNLDESRPSS